MSRSRLAVLLAAPALVLSALVTVSTVTAPSAYATGSLSHGNLTMVSTHFDGTSGPALPTTLGADEVAVSDDGKVIAFTSPVPADQLVTDPTQTGLVTDNNDSAPTQAGREDVFVWDSRVPAPAGPIVSLVSWNNSHTGTGNAASVHPVMAPQGIGLVFQSSATDLTTVSVGATSQHLYAWAPVVSLLHPLFMVDENYQGSAGSDSVSSDPSIGISLAPPAVRVAFTSSGDDLVDPTQHAASGASQVYVRTFTLPSPSTQLVSVKSDGGDGTVSGAQEPEISADGIHVVFSSGGDDLIGNNPSTGSNIYERNLLTQATKLISATGSASTSGNNSPVVSADGGAVAWDSNDVNLSATPHAALAHVFYRNGSNPVQMVDTDYTGALGCNSASNWPGISADGTMVDFESFCSDIVPPSMTATGTQVYARRMAPDPAVPALPDAAPQLVSVNKDGTGAGNSDAQMCSGSEPPQCGASTDPSVTMNADGTAIVFFSGSSDIAPPPNPPPPNFGTVNVYVRYPDVLGGGKTVNETINTLGQNPDGDARDPVISKDGGTVGFVSLADDLVTPDTNESTDVFAADVHNQFFIQSIAPVSEGAGSVTITVGRTGADATTDSVEMKTGDGFDTSIAPNPFPAATEADQPGDYTETDKTMTFPPGVPVETFTVPITDDSVAEGPEVFHVSLSTAGGAGAVALPGPLSDADVEILDDDGPSQDWSAAVTSAPTNAVVGETVPVTTTITVQSGADDLTVNSLAAGAGTSGLDDVAYTETTPFTVAAGTTKDVHATARVVAAPGAAGVELETSIDGTLGAANGIRTADTAPITVHEGVTATLTGAPATANLSDQITYTLTLTNNSGTAAQVAAPAAGFGAPTGTTFVARADGAAALAPGASTAYTLTVSVDDADADTTTITLAPTLVTYAMSDISLPSRAVTVAPETTTVQAPVVDVGPHTLVDHDGGTLLAGDTVDASVTVHNSGHAATTATLTDTLANLQNPTGLQVDGSACGSCTVAGGVVTAPGLALAAGATHTLTFSGTVAAVADGSTVSSSAVVTYAPATTGSSPTPADVQTLTVGSTNAQDWHVTISQQPPASAHVGDTVTTKATISVGAGADDLDVSALASGAGTSGLDQVSFGTAPPFTVLTGTSKQVTVTARVVAAPGAGGTALEADVTGQLGIAAPQTKSATTQAITSTEAVTAALSGGPANVTTADQITYHLAFANGSDTAAQLGGLPAALVAPTGTTAVGPASGPASVAAHGSATWTLTVDVDDADADATVLTQSPGATTYAMSAVGLAARSVAVTPPSVSSTVSVPDTTDPDVTIDKASGQADPASATPVHFTATFSEPVTGFGPEDVLLSSSTAGGPLTAVVTGGPTTYDVAVSGMSQSGNVVASVAAGGAQDGSNNPNTASTSSDNSVAWLLPIASHVAVTTTPAAPVYGQPVTATGTVTVDSGSVAGTVQFAVDGVDQGSPVTVSGGTATSAALTATGGATLDPGAHQVSASFAPSAPPYSPSSGSASLPVSKATTKTSVSVSATAISAHVAAVAPGQGAPTGSVAFSVDGQSVGSAALTASGDATLSHASSGTVTAVYAGDTHFTGSLASTAAHDPSISAKVTSAHPKSRFGWYRSPVTVKFTCTTNGSPLTAACPAPVTLSHNGAGQSVTRTVTAADGGADTVTVNHIDIDRTAPHVTVAGVTPGGRYPSPGPTASCSATDALSGVASCRLTQSRHHHGVTTTVSYRVRATDRAGNVSVGHGSYDISAIAFQGAPYTDGAYTVRLRQTYLLVVHSVDRPTYLDAAPYPATPFHVDPFPFRSAGHDLWSVPITMNPELAEHRYWNVGVRLDGQLHVIKLRVLS